MTKLESTKSFFGPSTRVVDILAEPAHEQYVHASGGGKWGVAILPVLYENVKDMNDPSIPIGMAPLIVVRQDHDVTSPLRADSILLASEVVRCIVDTKSAVEVKFVILDIDAVPVCIRELVFIAVIGKAACTCKQVVMEPSPKMLGAS